MSEELDRSVEFVAKYTNLKPVIVENVVRTTVDSALKGFVEARVLEEVYRPCVNCGYPKAAHIHIFGREAFVHHISFCGSYNGNLQMEQSNDST